MLSYVKSLYFPRFLLVKIFPLLSCYLLGIVRYIVAKWSWHSSDTRWHLFEHCGPCILNVRFQETGKYVGVRYRREILKGLLLYGQTKMKVMEVRDRGATFH